MKMFYKLGAWYKNIFIQNGKFCIIHLNTFGIKAPLGYKNTFFENTFFESVSPDLIQVFFLSRRCAFQKLNTVYFNELILILED